MEPSGRVEFDITSVKLIAGAQWGSGTLRYEGKNYPLKVKALSVGGVGYKEVKASGSVYDLKRLEDLMAEGLGVLILFTAMTLNSRQTEQHAW